jgi:plasmid stabilization system protein ParE
MPGRRSPLAAPIFRSTSFSTSGGPKTPPTHCTPKTSRPFRRHFAISRAATEGALPENIPRNSDASTEWRTNELAVRELSKARQDKESIFRWLHERSPSGAASWLRAYDALIDRLARDPASFGEAPERKDCEIDVRQALFKTRRGRVYRALFFLDGETVYVLRVRGPGQSPVESPDMQ